MRGSFHSVQRILKMLSATRSTVFFFFSMSAAMLCDNRDCYAQAAGDATVVYGDRVGNFVTANCDYWSNSGNNRAQDILYTAISVKGKYKKVGQVGDPVRLSPTHNDVKNLYDYNGSVALDDSRPVLYLVEVQVDFGDGLGYSTILSKQYDRK